MDEGFLRSSGRGAGLCARAEAGPRGADPAMESFSELVHKLRDAHERELEGLHLKVQELSSKKGCDTKRMEELFNRNQQMREQQRILTENIKTLENRLRAGLCDRCTVTQEVAKRREEEYEASQIQSLQQFSILVSEINNFKKENTRLKEELRSLRGALDRSQSEQSSNSTTPEVKQSRSTDPSPSAVPVALIATATRGAAKQPTDGDVEVKTEPNHKSEETMSEHTKVSAWNRGHFESYKPLLPSSVPQAPSKTDNVVIRRSSAERRNRSAEAPEHLLLRGSSSSSPSSSSSSSHGEVHGSRHVLHAPVPCRPRPVPWSLSEASDWVKLTASMGHLQPSPKFNQIHFPNLIPTNQHATHCDQSGQVKRPALGNSWPKRSPPQQQPREQIVVFQVRNPPGAGDSRTTAPEMKGKEAPPPPRPAAPQPPKVFGEEFREGSDGPLDLSDRRRSKSSQSGSDDRPQWKEESSVVRMPSSSSSSSPDVPPSASSAQHPQQHNSGDHTSKQGKGDHLSLQSTDEEPGPESTKGKSDQANGRKAPVLTIPLRPVVLLESLNAALHKRDSPSSNGKADDAGCSSEERDKDNSSVSGPESSSGSKRKRTSTDRDSDSDRDSDADDMQPARQIKIRAGRRELSPS